MWGSMPAITRYLWAHINWPLLGWTGLCLVLGLVFKKASDRVIRACERFWDNLAARPAQVVLLPAAASLLLGLLSLRLEGPPLPRAHDEFSYLLAADTFASGRVTNPTHPMWIFLETMHVIHKPSYVSIYPPAQGLVLAAGQRLLGHPWYGVLLSNIAMCAAVAWMLLGWLPRRWALVGGMLAACFSAFSYWSASYWGGAVAATGGALLAGYLPRLGRSPQVRHAMLAACGLAILANSRPYEGLVFSLACLAVAAFRMARGRGPSISALLRKVALPAACILVPAVAAMAFYFWRTTGSPARMPYGEQLKQYDYRRQFVWQSERPVPSYRHAEIRRMFTVLRREREPIGQKLREKLGPSLTLFFAGGSLAGLLVFGLWVVRDRRFRPLLGILFASVTGYALQTAMRPHYVAPVTGILLALQVQYLRHLRTVRAFGRQVGQLAFWSLLLLTLSVPLQRAGQRFLEPPSPRDWATDRQRLQSQLSRTGGQHVVIVRYTSGHNPHNEWVYNRADIDGSPVVWAREMEDNAALLSYFRSRSIWLLEADRFPRWLRPYTPKGSIIDNSCGAVPLDRAGRPRPALVRNQAKPDQGGRAAGEGARPPGTQPAVVKTWAGQDASERTTSREQCDCS